MKRLFQILMFVSCFLSVNATIRITEIMPSNVSTIVSDKYNYDGYITPKDAEILKAHIAPRYLGTSQNIYNTLPTAKDYFAVRDYLTSSQKITLSADRVKGDINGDGFVNILDLNILEKYSLKTIVC